MKRPVLAAVLAAAGIAWPPPANAHWAPHVHGHNASHAVRKAWCGNGRVWCNSAREAWAVARCESTWNQWATNGVYLGLFQLGPYARSRYGFRWDPWTQARAAHRYWLAAGWQPWECRP